MNRDILFNELNALIKTLNFIQEDQSAIKRKLSILLDQTVSIIFINWAEDLDQQMLNREVAIQLLRNDIIAFKHSLNIKKSIILFDGNKYFKLLVKFKEQISYLEKEYALWAKLTTIHFDQKNTEHSPN